MSTIEGFSGSSWVILCIHPNMGMLKKITAKLVEIFSSQFILATANSMKSAVNIIESQHKQSNTIALIILSDSLAEFKGLEAAEELKKHQHGAPIIMLKENPDLAKIRFLKPNLGIRRVIKMPFDPVDLQETVRLLCEHRLMGHQIEGFRETLEAMYEHLEERIDAGINDAGSRRDFLSAMVQSRIENFRSILFDAQMHMPALKEMIEFTDSIKPQMSPKDKKVLGPRLNQIYSSIEGIGKLDEQLRQSFEMHPEDFSLKSVVRHYFVRRRPLLKERGISFLEDIGSEIRVHADKAIFSAILRYLMLFFLDNRRTELEHRLHFKAVPDGLHINFELKGVGYYQSSEDVTHWLNENGSKQHAYCNATGLNLSTIEEFCRLNSSAFELLSHKNEVTFTLSLPASKTYLTLMASLKHTEATFDLGHLKVLVVENSDIQMLMLVRKLSQFGVHINICSSGFDALDLAEQGVYDFIFINVGMEGMDGYHTSQRVFEVQRRLGGNPTIILMAVGSEEFNKTKMKEAYAERIIIKPVPPEILKEIFWTQISVQLRNE